MSVEGKCFMEMASSSSCVKDGHYQLQLPFRNKDLIMPDNYNMAKQHTLHLLKKILEDVLKRGYGEKIPFQQLCREDGQV